MTQNIKDILLILFAAAAFVQFGLIVGYSIATKDSFRVDANLERMIGAE